MNKYVWLVIVIVAILGGGIAYTTFLSGGGESCPPTGVTREATVVAEKDEWRFTPEVIEVDCGDKVRMTVINKDDYDHGIAIDQFGISQRMPANGTIKVEFFASKPGEWPYFCSVPCGEGLVDGVKRTHFDMVGKLHVRSIISETQ